MRRTMKDLRKELGIVSQGRPRGENSILFHLAFKLTEEEAKKFILTSAELGLSESLYARIAILAKLKKEDK